jgi:hypothetical protein
MYKKHHSLKKKLKADTIESLKEKKRWLVCCSYYQLQYRFHVLPIPWLDIKRCVQSTIMPMRTEKKCWETNIKHNMQTKKMCMENIDIFYSETLNGEQK